MTDMKTNMGEMGTREKKWRRYTYAGDGTEHKNIKSSNKHDASKVK